MLSPPRRGRVFERIVGHVRDAILTGRLKPGDRLAPERELVRQFRVGRGAVREAFRILEQSALIRIRPGKGGGAFVADRPTAAVTRSLSDLLRFGGIGLEDVVRARVALEGLIVDIVASRADADDLAFMAESVERATSLFEKGRRAEKREENFNFHVLLAEATGNPVYPLLLRSVVDVLEPIFAPTHVAELREGGVEEFEIDPARLGLAHENRAHIAGGSAAENAARIRAVLGGELGAARDIVVLNAAAALVVAETAASLEEGVALAQRALDSGAAAGKLRELAAFRP